MAILLLWFFFVQYGFSHRETQNPQAKVQYQTSTLATSAWSHQIAPTPYIAIYSDLGSTPFSGLDISQSAPSFPTLGRGQDGRVMALPTLLEDPQRQTSSLSSL